jgi:hypothetical protein
MKTFRRVALLLLVVLVAGAAALIGSSRPALDDAHDDAVTRWPTVAQPLDTRYERLAELGTAVEAAGGVATPIAADVEDASRTWERARDSGSTAEQVRAANVLEALNRRLATAIDGSARLSGDGAVTSARQAVRAVHIPESGRAYNSAVADYQGEREGTLRSMAASALGYDALPALDMGNAAPAPQA